MKALLHQGGKFVFAVDTVACRSLKNDEDYKVSVSVKTKEDIPKDQIFACIRAMKGITVPAPVHIGDVVLHDVAHTGVDVIATKNVEI